MSENPYAAPQTESPGPINLGQNPSPYGGYRDISSLVAVILIFLGIQAIAGIGQIVAALQMNEGLRLILEGEPAVEKIQAADSLSKGATGLRVLDLIITAIIWCIWKNKSCKRLALPGQQPSRQRFHKQPNPRLVCRQLLHPHRSSLETIPSDVLYPGSNR